MKYKPTEQFLAFLDDYIALLKKHDVAHSGDHIDAYDAINSTKEILEFLEFVAVKRPYIQ